MLDKILNAIEPFALTLIILAGANLAGYVKFSDGKMIGELTIFLGVLLVIKHIGRQLKNTPPTKTSKKSQ